MFHASVRRLTQVKLIYSNVYQLNQGVVYSHRITKTRACLAPRMSHEVAFWPTSHRLAVGFFRSTVNCFDWLVIGYIAFLVLLIPYRQKYSHIAIKIHAPPNMNSQRRSYLRNRKHFPCFHIVIQKHASGCLGEREIEVGTRVCRANVSTLFRVLPNFHECFCNLWEHGGNVFYFFYKITHK